MAVKNAVVGALRVVLGADTAIFEKSLKSANASLSRFGASVGKAMAAVAAAMTAVGAAVGVAVRGMLKEADQLTKLSRSIGVPVEQLSALKHAAELSGASVEQLGRLFRNVARNMQAAAQTPSAFSRSLDALGVAWRDAEGNFRRADELMMDVADRFKGMQDGAGKTALAMKIFGEEMGPRFLSMLNAGSDGIREMMREAEQLGITFDTKTGEAAERFNDALDKMGKAQKGIVTQITARMAPTFALLAESMVNTTKNSNALKYAVDALLVVLKGLLTAGTVITAIFREMGRTVAAVAGAVLAVAQGEFTQAAELVKRHWSNAKESVAADMQFIKDLWAETAAQTAETSTQFQELTAAPVVQSTKDMADAMRAFHEEAKAALDDVISSPTETFEAKMTALEAAVRRGTVSFREFGQIVKRIQDENISHWQNLGSTVASTLTSMFGRSKAAGIASAIINTAVGVTQALRSLPPPFSFAQAGLVAAAGAAQIASIKSTNIGGSGNVRRPTASAPAASSQPESGGAPVTVNLETFGGGKLLDFETMRNIIDELNSMHKNGYRLVTA